ncbi:MAG: hypothetical protein KKG04_00925, partial [Candidatus Thermoplasmatota archaeon]|nr:hypothetical protein [Candidatus Thermoplasmatota archaeon]
MKIVPFLEVGESVWDDFCLKSDTAWFRHTSYFIKYSNNLDFKQRSVNISFAIYHDKKMVAVVPLMIQPIAENENYFEFAMGTAEIPYPALSNEIHGGSLKTLIKFIFKKIDDLAKKYHVQYAKFFIDSLSDTLLSGKQKINPLP